MFSVVDGKIVQFNKVQYKYCRNYCNVLLSNLAITNCSGPSIFLRHNRVNLFNYVTNLTSKFVITVFHCIKIKRTRFSTVNKNTLVMSIKQSNFIVTIITRPLPPSSWERWCNDMNNRYP